jgi:hypothetical protein
MWELIFMLLVLKIPIAYLCAVVYWAIKSEPKPPEPALLAATVESPPNAPCAWRRSRRPRRGPHGSRGGGYVPASRSAVAR